VLNVFESVFETDTDVVAKLLSKVRFKEALDVLNWTQNGCDDSKWKIWSSSKINKSFEPAETSKFINQTC